MASKTRNFFRTYEEADIYIKNSEINRRSVNYKCILNTYGEFAGLKIVKNSKYRNKKK